MGSSERTEGCLFWLMRWLAAVSSFRCCVMASMAARCCASVKALWFTPRKSRTILSLPEALTTQKQEASLEHACGV